MSSKSSSKLTRVISHSPRRRYVRTEGPSAYPQSLAGGTLNRLHTRGRYNVYHRGCHLEEDIIYSFSTEGREGPRAIRKFHPQGEVDID